MIRCGHLAFDAPSLRELGEEIRRKLRPSVGGDGHRDTVVLNPSMGEGVDDALRGHVDHWDGYRPT